MIFGVVRTVVSVCGKRGAKLGEDGEMSSEKMGEAVDVSTFGCPIEWKRI